MSKVSPYSIFLYKEMREDNARRIVKSECFKQERQAKFMRELKFTKILFKYNIDVMIQSIMRRL